MQSTLQLALMLFAPEAAWALKNNPAVFGPPADANPLTFGWYGNHEVQTPTELDIEGTIPEWISGSLYRGGAGTWDVANYTAEHWFDGFSRNHRFEIADGVVTYRSRNSTDELMDFVEETGLYPDGSFGSDPCKAIFGAFEINFRDSTHERGDKSSANVGVAFVPNFGGLARKTNESTQGAPFDSLLVSTDANRLQQIDPVTLEPIELISYEAAHPLLKNDDRAAAHPAHSKDGIIYNYNLDMTATPPVYRVFGVPPSDGKATILAEITDAPPAYIHSLFSTENHIVLVVWQADFAQAGVTVVSSLGPWNPERKTLFYVIDRINGGVVSKYVSNEAFFAFHQINSYEEDCGDIIIDLPTMKDDAFLTAANVTNLRANVGGGHPSSVNDISGAYTRYRLPYNQQQSHNQNGTLQTQTAELIFQLPYNEANIELPRINEAYGRKRHQYGYGVHSGVAGSFSDSIIKVDTDNQSWKIWTPANKSLPSEPIFVARPGSTAEDDGVLLTVSLDSTERLSSLVVIDAQTMQQIGRAKMPVVMGYGFHGAWGSMKSSTCAV